MQNARQQKKSGWQMQNNRISFSNSFYKEIQEFSQKQKSTASGYIKSKNDSTPLFEMEELI